MKNQVNALGSAQQLVENAASNLKSKQKAFLKATRELEQAEQDYQIAVGNLNAQVGAVRERTKVVPLSAQ